MSCRFQHRVRACGTILLSVSWAQMSGAQSATDSADTGLQEIVVAAEKRAERLQEVPIGMTILNSADLIEQNTNKLEDYAKNIPGFSLTSQDQGTQLLVVRGVTTGRGTNPTVGVTVDDVPVGASVAVGDGDINTLDLDPSDLESIQLLKGPQGTLYGASSMGGLLKYVTSTPSLNALSGSIEADSAYVHNGDVGYGFRGQVSIPLISDVLAISISGHARRDPGFIDIPAQGRSNVNQAQYDGGHLTVLWRPSDALSVKVGALVQTNSGNGSSYYDTSFYLTPTIGDLKQSSLVGSGHYYNRNELYTLNVSEDFGWATLSSISGYATSAYDAQLDFAKLASTFDGLYGYNGALTVNQYTMKKFTEEIRLASQASTSLEWLAGVFYTHEDNPSVQTFYPVDPVTGVRQPYVGLSNYPLLYREYAGFGDLTYHLTERWKVQVGARYAENRQHYEEVDTGDFFCCENINASSADHALTHLFTTSFDLMPMLTVYGRVASGYRAGGPNSGAQFGTPPTYKPDKTENYEIGIKGNLWDRKISFDADVYYIDWKDIQLGVVDPSNYFEYLTNAGRARSQGVEGSLQFEPIERLKLSANFAYTDATLRRNLPAGGPLGVVGDRLPFTPEYTGLIAIEKSMPLNERWTGFAGADASYTGSRLDYFVDPGVPRSTIPGYTAADVHIGVRDPLWTINAFVNNAADKRGLATIDVKSENLGPQGQYEVIPITPRTVGISIRRRF